MHTDEITLATTLSYTVESEHEHAAAASKFAKRWEKRLFRLDADGTVNIFRDGASTHVTVECELTVAQALRLNASGVALPLVERLEDEYPTLLGGQHDLAGRVEELRALIDKPGTAAVALAV